MEAKRSRAERFCSGEPARLVTVPMNNSFGDPRKWGSKFITQWIDRNEAIALSVPPCLTEILDQAIKGILHEGILDETRRSTCENLTNRLQEVKTKSQKEILERVVYIYTLDTFLYPLINASLRNEDWSKIDTLGPFCFLLQYYMLNSMLMQGLGSEKRPSDIRVYRGLRLSNEDIENYKLAIGKQITWLGFTSTSKSRQVAEAFNSLYEGNILMTFHLQQRNLWNFISDIEKISSKQEEEEVLLMAGYIFTLDKFVPNPQTDHWEMQLSEGFI